MVGRSGMPPLPIWKKHSEKVQNLPGREAGSPRKSVQFGATLGRPCPYFWPAFGKFGGRHPPQLSGVLMCLKAVRGPLADDRPVRRYLHLRMFLIKSALINCFPLQYIKLYNLDYIIVHCLRSYIALQKSRMPFLLYIIR